MPHRTAAPPAPLHAGRHRGDASDSDDDTPSAGGAAAAAAATSSSISAADRVRLVPFTLPTLPDVFCFLQALTLSGRFSPPCNLVALIYLNRLVTNTHLVMHAGNWRPLLLVALLLAQKVWDDRSLSSRDFAVVCPLFTPTTIRRLERKFLAALAFSLEVSQSQYATYYFELRSLSSELSPATFPLLPLSAAEARRLEVRSQIGRQLPSLRSTLSAAARGRGGPHSVGGGGGSSASLPGSVGGGGGSTGGGGGSTGGGSTSTGGSCSVGGGNDLAAAAAASACAICGATVLAPAKACKATPSATSAATSRSGAPAALDLAVPTDAALYARSPAMSRFVLS